MQQRAHLKRKRKQIPKWKIFFFLMICALLCSFFCIFLAGKKLETIIINYATIETNRIASSILNSIVRDDLILPEEKLYEITMDNDQNIQLIDFNTKVSNELLSKLNREAMKRLIALENGDTKDLEVSNGLKGVNLRYLKGGVVCEIPLGVLLGNSLIVNSSSVIPIRFSFIGTVDSHLKTKVTPYGINNALIEIVAEVTITEQITMPHTTKKVPLTSEVTLVIELIQGKVPSFYQGSIDRNSNSLSLPISPIS